MASPALRITIIGINYAPEPSGNAPYTTRLAEGLISRGHCVRVITGYPHYPEWEIKEGYTGWSTREIINSVDVTRLRHFVSKRPGILARLHMELSFGVRAMLTNWGKPDVVLLVSPALFSSGLAALRARISFNRAGLGIWVQDIYGLGVSETRTASSVAAKLVSAAEASIFRKADGVVAIHNRFREYLTTSLSLSHESTAVIRNWTHLPPPPITNRSDIRAKLGWPPDAVIVLHAGNMGKKQGLENVVHAARIAQQRGSRVRFVLMGNGNQRSHLEELAEGATHIEFLSSLPDEEFQEALVSADVLLVNELPGVKEMAVPSKLTSYFNSGLPVIAATDAGSVTADEIDASGGGIRVKAGDPKAILEAAENLGRDEDMALRLGRAGQKFQRETLSEDAAIAQYDEFITSLAPSRSR